jgi:sorting and assembly machinery component 37
LIVAPPLEIEIEIRGLGRLFDNDLDHSAGDKISKMKLHILGPAFGLPSIDAECIAAVALIERYTQGSSQAWALIASHEAAPGTQFPFLQVGDKTYSGFDRIAQYLIDTSGSSVPGLATNLTAQQRADATA